MIISRAVWECDQYSVNQLQRYVHLMQELRILKFIRFNYHYGLTADAARQRYYITLMDLK